MENIKSKELRTPTGQIDENGSLLVSAVYKKQASESTSQDISSMSPVSKNLATEILELPPTIKKKVNLARLRTTVRDMMNSRPAIITRGRHCGPQSTRVESVKKDFPGLHRITTLLAYLTKIQDGLLVKKKKLISPTASPTRKKAKNVETEEPVRKPTTAGVSTNTVLLPSWWDSGSVAEAKEASRPKTVKMTPAVNTQHKAHRAEAESAIETGAENWTTVIKRQKLRSACTTEPRQPLTSARSHPKGFSKKPLTLHIKPCEDRTYFVW